MADLERIETEDVTENVDDYEGKEVTEATEQAEEEVYLPEPQKKKSKKGLIFKSAVGAGIGLGLYKLVIEPKLKARKLRKAKELLEAYGALVTMPEDVDELSCKSEPDEAYEETEEETNE